MRSPVFITLFFSIFIAVLGVGIVVPLLPVYAHSLGASGLAISMIFASFSISRTFLLPLFGKLSDRSGRKPFLVYGLLFYCVVSLLFLIAESVCELIAIRFIHGIASAMLMPVAQAYIGDITPKGKEGFFMGVFNLSMFISMSLGPLIGGILNARLGMNWAFIAMALMAFIGFLASLFFLPPASEESARKLNKSDYKWQIFMKDLLFVGVFLYRFAYASGISIIWCFLPILAHNRFHLESDVIGLLVMTGVFVSGILNMPMGWVADRKNKKVMIIAGGIIVAAALVWMGMAESVKELFAGAFLFGIGGGISMPALNAVAVDVGKEKAAMGGAMALIIGAHSLGMMLGAIAGGLAMDWLNPGMSFLVAAALLSGILVFVLGIFLYSWKKASEQKPC